MIVEAKTLLYVFKKNSDRESIQNCMKCGKRISVSTFFGNTDTFEGLCAI